MNLSRTKLVGVALVIFAGALWLYWPCVNAGFLNGDDEEYLRQAQQNGLTWHGVQWAFTSTPAFYQPVAHLSHFLDYQIWRRNPAGHHATNVILHAFNAALVFGFVWTLLGSISLTDRERLMVSLGVGVVFAIHPLHVESVAWTSDRPTLVCALFGIGSLWAYAAGLRRWKVWALYVAALLCKPTAVSLPFAMLAMDYFPLRRHEQLGWGRLVREKVVWIGLAVALGVATMITESHARTLVPLKDDPLSQRVWVMVQGLAFYPWKLVWPWRLLPYYPLRPGLSLFQWPVLMSLVGVVAITALAVWGWRRLPALAAGWFAYVMLVLPVSGLTQTGSQLVALRYAYVLILPPLLLVGGAVLWIWRRSTTAMRLALIGLLAAELSGFAVATRRLIPDWHDDVALWRAVLADFPDLEGPHRWLAGILLGQGKAEEALVYAQQDVELAPQMWETHMTLGSVLSRLGRRQEAIVQEEQSLRINPNSALGHYDFGLALMELGRVPEAAEHFEQALQIEPNFAEAHLNLGVELETLGRATDAIGHYEQALRIKPDYAEAQANLASALATQGRVQEAITHYSEAVRIKPDFAGAYYNRGVILEQVGRLPEAIADYEEALRINPDYARAHFHLGGALEKQRKTADAIRQYEEALRIKPDYAEGHNRLGLALKKMGKASEAARHYEEALRINPDYPEAQNNLAWLLATRVPAEGGDPVRAVALAERACKLTDNRVPTCLDTLAAAYAAAGRFNDAVGTAQKAIPLAESTAQTQLVSRIEMRLELYRANRAYYEPPNVTSPRTP